MKFKILLLFLFSIITFQSKASFINTDVDLFTSLFWSSNNSVNVVEGESEWNAVFFNGQHHFEFDIEENFFLLTHIHTDSTLHGMPRFNVYNLFPSVGEIIDFDFEYFGLPNAPLVSYDYLTGNLEITGQNSFSNNDYIRVNFTFSDSVDASEPEISILLLLFVSIIFLRRKI